MPNTITVIRHAEGSALGDATPAKFPVGDVVAHARLGQAVTLEESTASVGVWECSPGMFRRAVMNREFSHIISGWCTFTPDGGETIELRAGDAVLFPADCEGVWDIREKLRKTYVIF
ncbi:cupin domain-containing protein [Pseudomonas sp. LFM046]|uniref:cupin domain-containing protein n=1 Tax=Pseudomonas sp. LFM046 TaxID=1608357 RepID=UPI0005CFC83D|nr:cupin domain-containing protein [Pseudomonas sp. LFM046]